jgi:Zn-dependent peptidase ImmA (M78 family)/transcriptional regulator with XRE-family HTH domain
MIEVSGAQIDQARPVVHAFSPARLTLARQVAGRTKRQLAEAIDKTAAAVTQFELGQARPSAETLACCAQALDLPVKFFAAGRPQLVVDTGMAHFRSLRATRAYQREQAMGLTALLWEVVEAVEQVVELPPVRLPGISDFARFGSPAEAARELRRFWDVSGGPLPHLVRHAEANGIVTCVLPRTLTGEIAAGSPEHMAGVSNVDAFSTRVSQRSLIGLTGAKGGLLRRRFNVAHELGHLLLHPEARPGDHLHEREAHLFAAELLMPEASIVQELPARPDPGRLLPLQRRWGASVSALAFRGRTLGRYTEPQLKRLMITLSQLGWRTNEPEDQSLLEGEEPALLRQALELASSAGMSVSSLADQLKLPPGLVRTFLGMPDSKPRLTLLKKPLPAGRAVAVCSTLSRVYKDAYIWRLACT